VSRWLDIALGQSIRSVIDHPRAIDEEQQRDDDQLRCTEWLASRISAGDPRWRDRVIAEHRRVSQIAKL